MVQPGVTAARRAAPATGARRAGWLCMHLLIAAAPSPCACRRSEPGRGFVIDLSVALGFVALSVLGLQFALAARFSRSSAPFGIDVVLTYHRQISFLAVAAAFAHPVLLFLADDRYLALLDLTHLPLRAAFAWLSVAALGLLMVTSIWRRALRLSYQVWHVLHSALGVFIVLAALGHAFLVDYYFSVPLVRGLWIVYTAAFLWLAVWVRLVKPLRLGLRPWRVVELWPEPGGSLTLSLEPVFRARGAGVLVPRGPVRLDPAEPEPVHPHLSPLLHLLERAVAPRVEFTIKQVGEFTGSMRRLRVGDRVYLDGPHGSFTLESHPGMGYVFVAAGVGVTPFLSMLATLADQGDQRPAGSSSATGTRTRSPASDSSPACRAGSTCAWSTSSAGRRTSGTANGGASTPGARPAPAPRAPFPASTSSAPAGRWSARWRRPSAAWASPATTSTANSSGWSDMRPIGATSAALMTSVVLLALCLLVAIAQG